MDPALAVEVATLSQQRAIDEAIEKGGSDIQQFYKYSTVLVTGGSGFIGKQLIEKLFRSCEISKMYVLLRPKKGKSIYERLEDILKDPVYDAVRKRCPDFRDRLVPIPGDVSELRLGISSEDWLRITSEVDVIIHAAATVSFDEPLKVATLTNVRGSIEVIRLGQACKKIRSMVHVSTAFAHATRSRVASEVAEKMYPSPIPPETLIELAESVDEQRLNDLTPHLIKDWPNTYTFTKAVAEEAVRTMAGDLPICVVRPAIVIGSYREPAPGWLDLGCAYGPSGLILGVGVGVVHVLFGEPTNRMDLVPVDMVNNAIIAAGANVTREKTVFTVTSTRNQVTWSELTSFMDTVVKPKYPTPRCVYYPFYVNASRQWMYLLLSFFLHIVPGYIVDFGAALFGYPKRLQKLYKKAEKLTLVLSYFTCNNWKFLDHNLEDLYHSMSETDRTIFNFNICSMDWQEMELLWAIGIRKYIVKDRLKGSEYAAKKQKYLKILNYFVLSIYLYLWYLVLGAAFRVIYFVFSCIF